MAITRGKFMSKVLKFPQKEMEGKQFDPDKDLPSILYFDEETGVYSDIPIQPERSKQEDSCAHEWHEQIFRGDLPSIWFCQKCNIEMRCSEH